MNTPTKKHQVLVRLDDEELAGLRDIAVRFGVNLPTAFRIASQLTRTEILGARARA